MSDDLSDFLSRSEAAHLLEITPTTLFAWAKKGHGPTPIRLAPRTVVYRKSDVERFIAERAAPPATPQDLLFADRERVIALHLATPPGREVDRDRAIMDGVSVEAFVALLNEAA